MSSAAYREYERFCAAHPAFASAWIDVIAQRPWSQEIAALTAVEHESPQALLLSAGHPLWHASHTAITAAALEGAAAAS